VTSFNGYKKTRATPKNTSNDERTRVTRYDIFFWQGVYKNRRGSSSARLNTESLKGLIYMSIFALEVKKQMYS
jgi:hypothetical protein